uniref:Uncharacterized protein n=1 Tax=Myoviridae sp. ctGrV43 TaxID=2825075 RepID=A0A8S5UF09_9CAUD|nr:MAG TPA: hypothetical protein [Myoviridae sp. ctGrV43]DAV26212.1 MAG TPA: hypothetical protein [Caudoviricetes sp.]
MAKIWRNSDVQMKSSFLYNVSIRRKQYAYVREPL